MGEQGMAAGYKRREVVMTCAEFQKVLPFIIETGGSEQEQEHLRTCHICSDLVRDLKYIAEQAKLLVAMEDPDPKVWNNIQHQIDHEGLAKPPQAKRTF